jgi:hypothetical protein
MHINQQQNDTNTSSGTTNQNVFGQLLNSLMNTNQISNTPVQAPAPVLPTPKLQSPFGIKKQGTELMVTAPHMFFHGGYTTSSAVEFYGHLSEKFPSGIVNRDNIILAGGIVAGMLQHNHDPELYKNSDLDFFVYGDLETVKKTILETYHYLNEIWSSANGCFAFMYDNSMVLTILIPNWRPIQLIGVNCKTPMDVLRRFDMTHCQVGYDGQNIIYTPEFIKSMETMTTKITTHSVHAYRIVKAYQRGFSIEMPKHKMYIKNYFADGYKAEDKTKPPPRTDKIWDQYEMNTLIHELVDNDIVKQNMGKNYVPECGNQFIQVDPQDLSKGHRMICATHEYYTKVKENIKKHYTENIIFIETEDQLSTELNKGTGRYLNVFK